MKRLLLAPLLLGFIPSVNAFPWSSDIVVKTDLGEKFIVKESAVRVIDKGISELIYVIDKDGEKTIKNFKRCNSTYGKDYGRRTKGGFSYCEKEYGMYYGFPNMQSADKDMASGEKEKTHFKNVIFRPIFEDLNKKKIAYDYENVYCINPKIRDQTLAIWDKYKKIKSYQPKKISFSAYESMKAKVCKKYAKFE